MADLPTSFTFEGIGEVDASTAQASPIYRSYVAMGLEVGSMDIPEGQKRSIAEAFRRSVVLGSRVSATAIEETGLEIDLGDTR